MTTPSLGPDQKRELFRAMVLNRLIEERLVNLYRQGKVVGGLYRSLGQEAISVGTAYALDEGDIVAPLIRNLGSILVRGVTARDVLTQYMARATSPSGGKDCNLHFSVPEKGIYSPISMLGTLIPVVTGMLLGDRLKGRKTVGLTYIGDGGTSVGAFHEGLTFAAVQKLPLVLIVEFNHWAYSTPYEKQCAAKTLADKAPGYGIPGEVVDGNDVEATYRATRLAVERARAGHGPTLIECKTYRMRGHAEHDAQSYVDRAELEAWKARDPIRRYEEILEADGILEEAARVELMAALNAQLDADVAFAEASPFPDPSIAFDNVYADPSITRRARAGVFVGAL